MRKQASSYSTHSIRLPISSSYDVAAADADALQGAGKPCAAFG